MKVSLKEWGEFLALLPEWAELPAHLRKYFYHTSLTTPAWYYDLKAADQLVKLKWLVRSNYGRGSADRRVNGFVQVLSICRPQVPDANQPPGLVQYLRHLLKDPELNALDPAARGNAPAKANHVVQVMTAQGYVDGFLAAKGPAWERERLVRPSLPILPEPAQLQQAQQAWHNLQTAGAAVPIAQFVAAYGATPVYFGLRYVLWSLLFDPTTFEIGCGLWSAYTPGMPDLDAPPAPTAVTETFTSPVLLDDMATMLARAAAEPLRIKAQDGWLYVKTQRELEQAISALPTWIAPYAHVSVAQRIAQAFFFLEELDLLVEGLSERMERQLSVSAVGQRWLGQSVQERLDGMLTVLLKAQKDEESDAAYHEGPGLYLPIKVFVHGRPPTPVKQERSVRAAFLKAPEAFLPIDRFLDYHSEYGNPLPLQDKSARVLQFSVLNRYYGSPQPEQLLEIWRAVLQMFLLERLFALAGVTYGQAADGRTCFQLTSIGRYLLGEGTTYALPAPAPGTVIVQPNFDVVFLAPAPALEMEIARFAERRGRTLGVLFHLTKAAALLAAGGGLTAEQALATLRSAAATELPDNVERELRGWFGALRKVSVRSLMVIDCNDAETARRVIGLAKAAVKPLTDTLLELTDEKQRTTLLRKLRQDGIFLNEAAPARKGLKY